MRKTAADLDPASVLLLSQAARERNTESPRHGYGQPNTRQQCREAEEPASARPNCIAAALLLISSVSFTPENTFCPLAVGS